MWIDWKLWRIYLNVILYMRLVWRFVLKVLFNSISMLIGISFYRILLKICNFFSQNERELKFQNMFSVFMQKSWPNRQIMMMKKIKIFTWIWRTCQETWIDSEAKWLDQIRWPSQTMHWIKRNKINSTRNRRSNSIKSPG